MSVPWSDSWGENIPQRQAFSRRGLAIIF
jgi:hypothetical protein